ncbi:MAG: methylated-DNA--[protein]-cysteine S-methyltransferase, partial [Nitrospinaceae bacterium]
MKSSQPPVSSSKMPSGKSKELSRVHYTVISTPLGLTGIAATESGLCRVVLSLKSESQFLKILQKSIHPSPRRDPQALAGTIRQFQSYFSGKLKRFTCKLDLSRGTRFQQSVWRKLQAIPYGKTRSYRWVAGAIRRPKAVRAVGNANGRNPLPIVVPCHRV